MAVPTRNNRTIDLGEGWSGEGGARRGGVGGGSGWRLSGEGEHTYQDVIEEEKLSALQSLPTHLPHGAFSNEDPPRDQQYLHTNTLSVLHSSHPHHHTLTAPPVNLL